MKSPKNKIILTVIVFAFFSSLLLPQTKTNLQKINELVDISTTEIIKKLSGNFSKVIINFELGNDYGIFKNRIINNFKKNNLDVLFEKKIKNNTLEINYTLEIVDVNYSNMEREGLLGDYLLNRGIKIEGSYSIVREEVKVKEFSYSTNDTVTVNDLKSIENSSYQFTQSEKPGEPFFSSITEPVIAIGSVAIAVILLFTIRSK